MLLNCQHNLHVRIIRCLRYTNRALVQPQPAQFCKCCLLWCDWYSLASIQSCSQISSCSVATRRRLECGDRQRWWWYWAARQMPLLNDQTQLRDNMAPNDARSTRVLSTVITVSFACSTNNRSRNSQFPAGAINDPSLQGHSNGNLSLSIATN